MRVRLTLTLFLGILFSMELPAQSDRFQIGYGGSGYEKFSDVDALPAGGFLATGCTNSFGAGGYDILLMRIDSNGDQLWTKTLGAAGDDFANCMTLLSDGSLLVAGTTESFTSPGQSIAFASRLDSSGNVIWFKTFRDSIAHYFNDVTERADHSIFLAGMAFYAQSQTIECNSFVVIDTAGNVLWSKKITTPSAFSQTTSVTALPGGSIIAAGKHASVVNDFGMLMRITPNGIIGWSKEVNSPGVGLFYDVCYAGGKRCAAVGATNSAGAGDYDVFLTLFDTMGVHKKTRTYGTPQSDYGYSIIACADGGFAITGITEDAWGTGQYDPFILRTDSLGNQLWLKVLGTTYPDIFSAISSADNGGFVMCGSSQGLGNVTNESAFMVVTDSLGQADCNSISFQFQTDSITNYTNLPSTFTSFVYASSYRAISSQLVPGIETYPLCVTGINGEEENTSVSLYPQPVTGQLSVAGIPQETTLIRIYNLNGQVLLEQSFENSPGTIVLNVSALTSGLYYLSFVSETNILTRKFIISSQ